MNGDGAFQAGEGLAGVDVILTGDLDGDGAAETIRTTTVAGGTYSFVGLPAGTFQVTVDTADIVPAGLLAWVDPDGTRDSTTQVTVTAGQSSTTTDFGYVAPASLSGVVFNDISGNGSQGAGELGTSGVTVYLDLNLNGALDLGESTQVTNSSGAYLFTNLLPGIYVVRELWPDSTVQTTAPNNGSLTEILTVGENATGLNFGNQAVSPQMLDDGDPGFSVISGAWTTSSCSSFVNADARYVCTTGGGSVIQWQFNNLTPGATYRVSTTWLAAATFSTDAPFTVAGGAAPVTLGINQTAPPGAYADSFTVGGITWKDIASAYTIAGNTLTVQLSNNVTGGCAVGDAVRIIEVTTPEITVLDGGAAMTDGSTTPLDLGGSPVGVPWTRIFTIRNAGGEPLQLGNLSVPTGFSIATGLGATTLAPGAQTTFVLRFDALADGVTYTGDLVLGNNDNTEAPFNFRITARVGAGLTQAAQSTDPTPSLPPGSFATPSNVTDVSTSTLLLNALSTVAYGAHSSPANVTRQYRIDNPGTSPFTMNSTIVAPSGFTVSGLSGTTVNPGGTATFNVTLSGGSSSSVRCWRTLRSPARRGRPWPRSRESLRRSSSKRRPCGRRRRRSPRAGWGTSR